MKKIERKMDYHDRYKLRKISEQNLISNKYKSINY